MNEINNNKKFNCFCFRRLDRHTSYTNHNLVRIFHSQVYSCGLVLDEQVKCLSLNRERVHVFPISLTVGSFFYLFIPSYIHTCLL